MSKKERIERLERLVDRLYRRNDRLVDEMRQARQDIWRLNALKDVHHTYSYDALMADGGERRIRTTVHRSGYIDDKDGRQWDAEMLNYEPAPEPDDEPEPLEWNPILFQAPDDCLEGRDLCDSEVCRGMPNCVIPRQQSRWTPAVIGGVYNLGSASEPGKYIATGTDTLEKVE